LEYENPKKRGCLPQRIIQIKIIPATGVEEGEASDAPRLWIEEIPSKPKKAQKSLTKPI
jgi:hypothetical protein